MAWEKNAAQTLMVTFYAAGVPTAPTGALTATISQDGAGFGAIAGSVAQVVGEACALLSLAAADTNCDTGVVKIVDAGGTAEDRYVEFVTETAYTAARATAIDTVAGDVAGLDGATMRGTDNAATAAALTTHDGKLDTVDANVDAILADTSTDGVVVAAASKTGYALSPAGVTAAQSGLSTLTAQQVWEYGTRTLTAFGSLVADIWAHASAAAIKAATDALAAIMPGGVFTAASLANVPTAFGDGDFPVTLTVEDDNGDPVASARLTVQGLPPQTSDADGAFQSDWALSAGTYVVTILTGAGYTPVNPYSLVVAADGSVTTPTGGAFVVPKLATPAPTPDGYCTVWCLAGTEGSETPDGSFYVSEVFSPDVYDPDGTPVEIVRGGTSMALVDGAAYRQVRQDAVVTFVLATPGKQVEWSRVVIPETAEAYVQNLLAEE